jgi:thiosulfate dehydrogenase
MPAVDRFELMRRLLLLATAISLGVVTPIAEVHNDDTRELISYGRELIEHTAVYLGPRGKIAQLSNGMNCQNCHLKAGTKPFALNYRAVASTYPKFRHRSGTIEGFAKRINDCIERSLNGNPLPDSGREMKAMIAYITWVGRDVKPGTVPEGSGLPAIAYLERAASPENGRAHYLKYCASCHGHEGKGVKAANGVEWLYPPLWGSESYNTGAGLYRISKLAAFVRTNMPYGVSHDGPLLSEEEAWDVAAYVCSMPRPHKVFGGDWPDVLHKPVDHPFGPYADTFSEMHHKYGPFGPMRKKIKS